MHELDGGGKPDLEFTCSCGKLLGTIAQNASPAELEQFRESLEEKGYFAVHHAGWFCSKACAEAFFHRVSESHAECYFGCTISRWAAMRIPLGPIDIPELWQLPAERRDALLADCAKDADAGALGWGTFPFRLGAVLTMLVIVPLIVAQNTSIIMCLAAGLAAMLIGIVAGLPIMLLMQRRSLVRLIRERIRRDARPLT